MPTRNMSQPSVRKAEGRDGFERPITRHQSYSKDQLASHSSGDGAVTPPPIVRHFPKEIAPIRLPEGSRPNELLLYDVRQHASFPDHPAECANSGSHGREVVPVLDTSHEVMVEPDGIEPTTSCLQSTRSPN